MGTLYYGDNLDILRRYLKDESVDLVYLDPPFNSAQNYNAFFQEKDGSAAEVDNAVSAMTSLLEPLLIIFLAVVVGSIVIALFLPILALINPDAVPNPNGADS